MQLAPTISYDSYAATVTTMRSGHVALRSAAIAVGSLVDTTSYGVARGCKVRTVTSPKGSFDVTCGCMPIKYVFSNFIGTCTGLPNVIFDLFDIDSSTLYFFYYTLVLPFIEFKHALLMLLSRVKAIAFFNVRGTKEIVWAINCQLGSFPTHTNTLSALH